jgi:uncharacterized protein YbjQ (UPF0145 family)
VAVRQAAKYEVPQTKMLPCPLRQENYVNFNAKIYIMVDQQLITASNQLEGYRITKHLGVVRGITVRSRSIFGNIGAGFQSLVGGKITIFVELCEKAREEAFQQMINHANERGANAIINIRYDANEVMAGVTEVLCYGTAVQVVNA